MSGWAMLGLLIFAVIIAWLFVKVWELIAGPPDHVIHTDDVKGWWYHDGLEWWHYDDLSKDWHRGY